MQSFDPHAYGPVLAPLVDVERRRPLGPGSENQSALGALRQLSVAEAFAHTTLADDEMARCTLAGVWLLHDFLDRSHSISQGVETATGSYWHGIMHRREGDFSNAKYWFRRVGAHPALVDVESAATALGYDRWDPYDFVDACESASAGGDRSLCEQVQQAEWEILLDYCYRRACDAD